MQKHVAFVFSLLAIWIALTVSTAAKEVRLALVIGNASYNSAPDLDNPVHDATLMAKVLNDVGFSVTLITEADQVTLGKAISEFGRALRKAGEEATGLFYYAGHGVQSFGTNYLLPVDVELQNAADLSVVDVPAYAVLRQMYSAQNRANIVILDACRNNPFEHITDLTDNGLAEMKAPRGTFPGLFDGSGRNCL